jgi:hypothetical protein
MRRWSPSHRMRVNYCVGTCRLACGFVSGTSRSYFQLLVHFAFESLIVCYRNQLAECVQLREPLKIVPRVGCPRAGLFILFSCALANPSRLHPRACCADPFADPFTDEKANDSSTTKDYVHIRIQQRNGRKSLTTVQVSTTRRIRAALRSGTYLKFGRHCCRGFKRALTTKRS